MTGRLLCRLLGWHNRTCRGRRDHDGTGRYWSLTDLWMRWGDPWWGRLGCLVKSTGCRMSHGHHLWQPLPDRYNELLMVPEERCISCGSTRAMRP